MLIHHPSAVLEVDLSAIVSNYRVLQRACGSSACAAVVKANGYGTGAVAVSRALANAGCETFFVAHLSEAIEIQTHINNATVAVFHGCDEASTGTFRAHGIVPVLNHAGQLAAWQAEARTSNQRLPAIIQVDTGMNRLGFSLAEFLRLCEQPTAFDGLNLHTLMSHLACADAPEHPLNAQQAARFKQAATALPGVKASLANSAGIFLGDAYRYHLARPGIAVYGINPIPGQPSPVQPVASLRAQIIQVRTVDSAEPVGYGATRTVPAGTRLATLGIGYADGIPWHLGNNMNVFLGELPLPVVGRVTMDLIVVDASAAPEALAHPGAWVEVLGPRNTLEHLASRIGTIPYELLTRLGRRFQVNYTGASA